MHHRATHLRADGLSPVHVATAAGASGGAGAASSAPASATASGGSSGGSNGHGQYRYTPLATSTNSSSSDDEGLALHHHRSSTTWERLHWALIKHRWPLLGALGLLVLALLLLGPKLQQAMSELPPWKHTFRSLTGVCKEEEEFERLGRALWVSGDAIPKRFGCDPLQCHCIFLLAGDDEEGATTAPTATRIQQQQQKQQHQHRSTSTRKRGGSAGRDGGRALMGEEAGAAGWSSSGRHHTHKVQEQQQQQLSHPARREEGAGDPSSSSSSSTTSSYIRGLVLPGALRRVNFFQQDKPLCLIPGVRYDDLVQENRLDAARTTRLAKGPSLFYTSDIENPFHIAHFRARPIFDFMVRQGLEAGQAHFFEPKPKAMMPGGYGVFLMSLLGEQLWRDDFPEGSSVLFDDLWVRPRGKWLFEVHDAFPETHDPKASQGAVMYGPHVDPKWNQMARFVRRQVLGQGQVDGRKEENDDQPYVLLVDRIKSRRLLDARTGSFEEVMRVLREEGGLRNVEAIRFEEVPVEEQFHKVMRARILVAVHGAGLTNMLWQPPFDSSVVEVVFSPRKPDYPNMARTIGRGYHYVWAERAEEKYVTPGEKTPNPISYRRVYVDSRKLLAAIKEAMAQRRGGVPGSLCC